MIDYVDLLGVQFAYGGRGPDSYDCYGLDIECNRRNGVIIPDVRSPDVISEIANLLAHEKYKWTCHGTKTTGEDVPSSILVPGRTIVLRVKGLACHVGYIHRPRHFLHTMENSGGVREEEIFDWKSRILGVYEYDG